MAKSKKDKASKKALSKGNLYSQEAVSAFFTHFAFQPDNDEVLRKAIETYLQIALPNRDISLTITVPTLPASISVSKELNAGLLRFVPEYPSSLKC